MTAPAAKSAGLGLRRATTLLLLLGYLLAAVTLAAVAAYVWELRQSAQQLRESTLERGSQHAAEMADVVARQMEAILKGFDLTLLQLREQYTHGTAADFERAVAVALAALGDKSLQGVAIVDATGHVAFSSISPAQRGVYLGDREYVRGQAATGDDRLLINQPVRSRLLDSWSVPVSRPIRVGGRHAGAVVLGVKPDYFARRLIDPRLSEHDVVAVFHPDGSYLARNRALERVLGTRAPAERPFVGPGAAARGTLRITAPVDGRRRIYAWQRVAGSDVVVDVGLDEETLFAPIESAIERSYARGWRISVLLLLLGFGSSGLLLYVGRDIASRRAAERKLQLAASMFAHTHEGIFYCDAAGLIVDVNGAFTELTGYSREEAIGRDFRFFDAGRLGAEALEADWVLREDGSWRGEVWNRHKSGEVFAGLLSVSAIARPDGGAAYVGIFSDITSLKESERRLERLAYFDALTGLPNRSLFRDRLEQALAGARRKEEVLAVAMVDLDGFKPVNDTHGHRAGDDILVEVARRLAAGVRAADTVCRLGGDEFVLLLRDLASTEEAGAILERLRAAVAGPYACGATEVCGVSASLGYACHPADGGDVETLLRLADAAMYAAKRTGGDGVRRTPATAPGADAPTP